MAMALPKSMRYLAAATLCIFVYLFLQLLATPDAALQLPASKPPTSKHGEWHHDPQLDRTSAFLYMSSTGPACILQANCKRSIRRTPQPSAAGRRQQLCAKCPRQRAHQCHHPEPGAQRGAGRHAAEHARPGAHVEPQVQLPVDLLQRRALHRRVQEEDASSHQGRSALWCVRVPPPPSHTQRR